jgi:serine/threonine protein kinase
MNYSHRNINPKSVLLTKDLNVKLTNFGVCKKFQNFAKKLQSYVGEKEYMAPEV